MDKTFIGLLACLKLTTSTERSLTAGTKKYKTMTMTLDYPKMEESSDISLLKYGNPSQRWALASLVAKEITTITVVSIFTQLLSLPPPLMSLENTSKTFRNLNEHLIFKKILIILKRTSYFDIDLIIYGRSKVSFHEQFMQSSSQLRTLPHNDLTGRCLTIIHLTSQSSLSDVLDRCLEGHA